MTPLLVALTGALGVLARYYIAPIYVGASVALGIAAAAAGYGLAHAVRH